jgi:hypothetical protein
LTACRGRGRIRAKATRRTPYAENTPKANAAIDAQISIAKFNRSAIQSAFVDCIFGQGTGFISAIQDRSLKNSCSASFQFGIAFRSWAEQVPYRQVHEKIRIASLTNDAIVAESAAALTLFSIYQ